MKVNLTNAEKTALANYLAEKRFQKVKDELAKIDEDLSVTYFEKEFEFYNSILKATDEY